MTDDKKLAQGDKVQWSSHGSTVTGTVEKKITEDTDSKGRRSGGLVVVMQDSVRLQGILRCAARSVGQ